MFGFEKEPNVVPLIAGLGPKLLSQGPPLEPPVIKLPMTVLFEKVDDL